MPDPTTNGYLVDEYAILESLEARERMADTRSVVDVLQGDELESADSTKLYRKNIAGNSPDLNQTSECFRSPNT